MQFDLTAEQAATLSSAVHLVMEYLPVSDKKLKALTDAQQALYTALGPQRLFRTYDHQAAKSEGAREYRGSLTYTYGYEDHNGDENLAFHSPDVSLAVEYDRSCEEVSVTLNFDGTTFPVSGKEAEESYYKDRAYYLQIGQWHTPQFPNVLFFIFPAWYGSKVQLTISTPHGTQGGTWKLTKQGIVTESQTINIDIDFDCPPINRSVKEPA